MNAAKTDAKAIFLEALDCQGDDGLLRFLDQACGADAALRTRVEELLLAHRDAGAFLGGAGQEDATDKQPSIECAGTVLGSYKLLEQIGEGGMGLVFMAEQSKPVRRRVALKVLKPGMDTRQVVARFEAERQALALMDHPHICKVFDAGATESGRPYFVMELVRGVPITDFCDQHRFTTRQRLELFVIVCQAVQEAHRKGIIHRDLKPSNVLVTLHDTIAVPKIIDFGIAKATGQSLTEKTQFTKFAQMIGTPLYMSPEQAEMNGLDVDTAQRCLLAGRAAVRAADRHDAVRERDAEEGGPGRDAANHPRRGAAACRVIASARWGSRCLRQFRSGGPWTGVGSISC